MQAKTNTTTVEQARSALVVTLGETTRAQYGARVTYAEALFTAFDFPWFLVEHTDNTEPGKAVRLEKAKLFEGLKSINYSNPSKVWKDIREYGEKFAKKNGLFGMSVPTDGEGNEITEVEEGQSGANHTRSPMLRNVQDLTALWKFNHRQTALDARIQRAQGHIQQALKELGADVAAF